MLANPVPLSGDFGRPMLDKDNIINARDGESLYRQCIKLRRRLSGVPGFRPYLDEMEQREADGADPVSSLWQCFRSGMPLLTIYNASEPEEGQLSINTNLPEKKWGKEAAFLFIKSCMQQMKIPTQDTFSVSELYSDNTTGFIKVIKLVDRVLDILALSGKLHASTDSEDSRDGTEESSSSTAEKAPKSMTRRQYILRELVETERQYVHHLQNLQALKKELEEVGQLKGDSIHNIFLNLNNILDFAQRFLIRVEQQNELADSQQNWGAMFIHYKDPFRQYEPFIANQRRCETTCQLEWDRMVKTTRSDLTRQMLANPTILNGFLLKPFQRLTKYPLLLKDLQKQTEDPVLKKDLDGAITVIEDVLNQADASIDKETRDDALQDLTERIDDWKSLQLPSFGELLLLGTFTVMKEGNLRSEEKEYHIYLFHRILIMCKDVNAAKTKSKMGSSKATVSLRGKPRMNLKGRIYLTNVTNVTLSSSPGNYSLQISWKGESTVETFVIRFKNDETLKKWQNMIETQRSSCLMEAKQRGTSDTQLHSLAGMQIENPYANYDEDEDVPRYSNYSGTTYAGMGGAYYSEFNMSRNASSTSLRARSTTGSSGGNNSHHSTSRPRVPTGEIGSLPPLNTRVQPPTGDYGNESYFSPIERDTPPHSASTRSSAQSVFPPYHRGHPSITGLPPGAENYRNTAPALARNAQSGNPYLTHRNPGMRPSLPPGVPQSANVQNNRMRSASSPDIHPNVQHNRKYMSGENVPNVPPIPSYVTKQMPVPNRSQNNSPSSSGQIPIRTTTPTSYAPPPGARPPLPGHNYTYDQSYHQDPRKSGHVSSHSTGRPLSPIPAGPPADSEPYMPSQLKAKVCYEENYVSMIIPSNIQFRSLTDRIDAKLSRFTNHSIASGSVRLRYRDEDGDFVLIDSDEGVHEALLDWKEAHFASNGQNAELVLFAQATGADEAAG